MNNGKHEENYWLIKSPIFKRFVVLPLSFYFMNKEEEQNEFCTICECPQREVIEKSVYICCTYFDCSADH